MMDPWDKLKNQPFFYEDDFIVQEKDDDLFDHVDESLEEMADKEADEGVVGIADWEDWN